MRYVKSIKVIRYVRLKNRLSRVPFPWVTPDGQQGRLRMDDWIKSLPRKGWKLIDIIDYGAPIQECVWCGTTIRYAHLLSHDNSPLDMEAGCFCAEKLTNDYVTPKRKEKEFKQRQRWVKSSKWNMNYRGNVFRKDYQVLIFKIDDGYKLKIQSKWGKKKYCMTEEAKEAAFDYLVSAGKIKI